MVAADFRGVGNDEVRPIAQREAQLLKKLRRRRFVAELTQSSQLRFQRTCFRYGRLPVWIAGTLPVYKTRHCVGPAPVSRELAPLFLSR